MMALNAALQALQLADKSAIFLDTPADNYILHIAAQPSSLGSELAVAGCKNTVRLYNRDSFVLARTVSGHTDILTGLKFSHTTAHLLYTCSLDGTIRCWDLRKDGDKEVQKFSGGDSVHGCHLTAFDLNADEQFLCAGTEKTVDKDVLLIFWDTRNVEEPLGMYSESHNDDITQVCFHPSCSDTLMTGSTDGLVCVYDVSQATEDDALTTTLNSQSSVAEIGWCTVTDKPCIYCTTHINTFHVWDATEFDVIADISNTTGLSKPGRQVDYLLGCFEVDKRQLYLVAGSYSGQLHVMSVAGGGGGGRLDYVASLRGGHSGVVRCALWDDMRQSLVTGGEDSMLCLWKRASGEEVTTGTHRKAASHMKVRLKTSVNSRPHPSSRKKR